MTTLCDVFKAFSHCQKYNVAMNLHLWLTTTNVLPMSDSTTMRDVGETRAYLCYPRGCQSNCGYTSERNFSRQHDSQRGFVQIMGIVNQDFPQISTNGLSGDIWSHSCSKCHYPLSKFQTIWAFFHEHAHHARLDESSFCEWLPDFARCDDSSAHLRLLGTWLLGRHVSVWGDNWRKSRWERGRVTLVVTSCPTSRDDVIYFIEPQSNILALLLSSPIDSGLLLKTKGS